MSGWTQLIIFVLAFGLPALGAIWKKLEDQREKHRIEGLRDDAQREQLRTGRSPTGQAARVSMIQSGSQPADPASTEQLRRQRIAEIAARRRAQLEEFRRRQQQRIGQARTSPARVSTASSGGGTSRTRPPLVVGGRQTPIKPSSHDERPSKGKTVRDRIEQRARQKRQMQEQVAIDRRARAEQAARDERRSRQRSAQKGAKKPAHARQAAQQRNAGGHTTLHALDHPPSMPGTQQAKQIRVLGQVMTRQDWHRAIVVSELLAPPLALRPPDEGFES